ncbi:MAG: 30S ribosomal protein S9, partial [Candidatus Acidiferrum sp.]
MAEQVQYYGTGRRKSSVARVFLRPGDGGFKVNGRAFEEYFVTEAQRSMAKQPLHSSETVSTFNVVASVSGGGVNG